jgi:glycosyltransferase involved in cell wall biosynthesis
MVTPKISTVIIGKNEEQSLTRTLDSLKEFKGRGGDMVFVDTGSTDRTPEIAKEFGMRVFQEGKRFVITVSKKEADQINKKFVMNGEQEIISEGMELFNYSAARNYATAQARNDYIATIDCDEVFTAFNINELERIFDRGYGRVHYDYIWSHNPDGSPQVRFFSGSRLFNRQKMKWVGYIHETLAGAVPTGRQDGQSYTAPTEIVRIDHWGRYKPATYKYLATLAYATHIEPPNDRNLHYFGRELFFHKRYKSAINILTQHINLNGWNVERGQSMIFIGDCLMKLGKETDALDMWTKSFNVCGERRESIMRIADYHFKKNNLRLLNAWATMALEIPGTRYYTNLEENYTWKPHWYLYLAKWWLKDRAGSKHHFDRCLEYCPYNQRFLKDTKYYYPDYPDNGIDGWMTFPELYWLYSTAKKMDTVLEIGSWKGRSTHALLAGSKGVVTAVDHFKGSSDPKDFSCMLGKQQDIYGQFLKNVGHFKNLKTMKMSSEEAASKLKGNGIKFDMIFIDGEHTYESVKEDILLWKNRARKLICGHDYSSAWPNVIKATNEIIGKPDGVEKSIWYKHI